MKLRIRISKYHSWYFCQISPQIMLLPTQISVRRSKYCLEFITWGRLRIRKTNVAGLPKQFFTFSHSSVTAYTLGDRDSQVIYNKLCTRIKYLDVNRVNKFAIYLFVTLTIIEVFLLNFKYTKSRTIISNNNSNFINSNEIRLCHTHYLHLAKAVRGRQCGEISP